MNLYVGNLSYAAKEDDLRSLFEGYGNVVSVTIVKDKATQRPRGFGFVEMEASEEAQDAMRDLDGKQFFNRQLIVNEARPRERDGGNGGGGGNSRGNSSRSSYRNNRYDD